ncbi:aldo/keto reductase [Mangrovibacillus cuniculi]|uniref:Aldo/keto reductase n=1 Tax=Mangrovibacillus cuniculi TaxID=2593652 RepID=A0A7S8CEA4_9BACI|nr:aldo/keto reductase [Mangrovibacillus cuniculi]QPC48326.1 aldo/keto reductase [Mangrovibacillus cuniculi]
MNLTSTAAFHNGKAIPKVGLGVFKMSDEAETIRAVQHAIQTGYKLVDTAAIYQNEEAVGQGVRESGVAREDLYITSKVWNSDQGYETTLRAFDDTLKRLKMDYLDLYLIHWPVEGKINDTWKAMEKLYADGLIKSIGVSNFHQHHFEKLFTTANEKPVLNQVELHPHLSQQPLREYLAKEDIVVQAWSPLGQGQLLTNDTLKEIAGNYDRSVAQVILRWHLQNDITIIPKSVTPSRIEENARLFDFELTKEDMERIDALNRDERVGPDPDNFDF